MTFPALRLLSRATPPTLPPQKADSQSGRIRVLSNEIKDLRSKISTVLDKTANDDQLINALRSQLEQARKRLGDQGKAAGERKELGDQGIFAQ